MVYFIGLFKLELVTDAITRSVHQATSVNNKAALLTNMDQKNTDIFTYCLKAFFIESIL